VPALDIESVKGLSSVEAAEKIRTEGYNELPDAKKHGIFGIIVEVIKEPMFILLVASGLIYFVLGDVTEGIMLMSFVFVIIGITVYQEQKTERFNVLDNNQFSTVSPPFLINTTEMHLLL
jgi:Ca2+-transporting ATPase